jgi:hypothetical protein
VQNKDDETMKCPKTIFAPSRNIYRQMIRAVAEKKESQSDDVFLLRFGLMENYIEYLNR